MTNNSPEEIEATLAHHEQQINDLSEMVARQWHEIDALKKYISKMKDKVESIEDSVRTGSDGEALSASDQAQRDKPPHY